MLRPASSLLFPKKLFILQVRPQKFLERQSSGDSRERRRQGQTGDTLVTSIKALARNRTQTKAGVREINQTISLHWGLWEELLLEAIAWYSLRVVKLV